MVKYLFIKKRQIKTILHIQTQLFIIARSLQLKEKVFSRKDLSYQDNKIMHRERELQMVTKFIYLPRAKRCIKTVSKYEMNELTLQP